MELKDLLWNTNIWWENKENINHLVETLERPELENVFTELNFHRITSIIGPRRTGKTTLIFQTIKKLINSGVEPKNILFVSLDNTSLKLLSKDVLEDVFTVYFEQILYQKPAVLSNKVYIFLDEIHKIENWAEWLKNKYDFLKNVKFIISGSSALKILKNTRETLVGRTSTLYLLPLTFKQFLKLKGIHIPYNFNEKNLDIDLLTKLHDSIKKDELKIKAILNEYLLAGGFIEWFKVNDIYRWAKYLEEDILDKLLLGDIISEYDLKDKEGLKRIVRVLASSQGNLFSLHSLSTEALVNKDIIENYIEVLKDGFIIYILENYSEHIGIVLRKNKKINLIDIGLVNSIQKNPKLSNEELGKFIEQTVQQQVYYYSQINGIEAGFYRDAKGREIDALLITNETTIPIEVKISNDASTENLDFFIKKFNSKFGIILTKSKLSFTDKIIRIPYWLFLAMI